MTMIRDTQRRDTQQGEGERREQEKGERQQGGDAGAKEEKRQQRTKVVALPSVMMIQHLWRDQDDDRQRTKVVRCPMLSKGCAPG